MFSMVLVPIYNTLGEQGMEFIMEESKRNFCKFTKFNRLYVKGK